jgi:hypothetical protein
MKCQIKRTRKECGENKGNNGTKMMEERKNKMRNCFNDKKKEERRGTRMTTRQ